MFLLGTHSRRKRYRREKQTSKQKRAQIAILGKNRHEGKVNVIRDTKLYMTINCILN